ncbi:MAG: hypothetical protein H7255_04270 [Ramlibacter sp.]|nr:hypothetical protein [Ramlibacter sp.]
MGDGDSPRPPPDDRFLGAESEGGIPPPPSDDDIPPPPPDDEDAAPPPPLTPARRLGEAVEKLELASALEVPAQAHHGQRTFDQNRGDRLTTAGNKFLKAVATFKTGEAFDANGEVSDPQRAAKHVIDAATQLDNFRGMRKDYSLSRHERLLASAEAKGERFDRLMPGDKGGFFVTKVRVADVPGLAHQPIDTLVESTRSQMVVPLKDLVEELNFGALTRPQLQQLEEAVSSLGITLGIAGDEATPRTALGKKFDAAHLAFAPKTKTKTLDRNAHASYVDPAIGDRFEVLSKDIEANWTRRKPSKAIDRTDQGSQVPKGTSSMQKAKNLIAPLRDRFTRGPTPVWREEPRTVHVDLEKPTQVPSKDVSEDEPMKPLSDQAKRWIDISSTAGPLPTPSKARRLFDMLRHNIGL